MRFSQNMTLVQRVSVYSDFSVPGCYGARLSQQSLSLLLFTRANQYVYANLDLNVSTDHPAQYMVIHQDMQFYDNQSVLIGTVPHNVLTSDPFPNGTDLVGYAVLDDDANLVIRRPNPENPVLSFTYYNSSIRGFCSHPLACGEYGLCNEETSTCSCPQGFTMATEKPSCDSQDEAARKCSCPEQFQMQKFGSTCIASDASYSLQPIEVLFPRQPSAIPIVSQEECRSLCAQNSSCNAALYDSSSSSCALFPILYTIATPSKGKSTGQILFTKISSIKKASNTATHVIVSSIVASAIIIVLLGVLVCCWWRIQKSTRKSQGHFLQEVPRLPHRFSFASLQAATRNFSKVIATGAHGSVFEGELSTPSGVVKVAVKKLHEVGNTMDDQFKAEVATIGSVSHVNLVSLKGFCMKKNSRLLVFEFMSNGSLEKWLYATETHRSMDMSIDGSRDILSETQQLGSSLPSSSPLRTVLDWNKRCRIALDTARGLEYLHHKSGTRIIHCDVKPANILLDKDFHAKVGDFGLAKLVCSDSRSFAMTKIQGTRGYLAPEWLQEASITTKSDVFSYGVVLIELLTGRQCIDAERGFMPTWVMKTVAAIGAPGYCTPQWVGMDDPISMISPSDAEALRSTIIDERLSADEVPTNTFLRTLLLALACVQTDPGDRPSMDSVVQILEDLTEAPSSLPDIKLSHLTCNPYCLLDKSTSSSRTDFPSGGFMSTYSQVEAR
ncbi:hypothetical protein KP509_11G047600 [Ceratopteris richardii]|nr:hypothetical protein KP509_11G047600 [Ceratopteris richardii]